MAGYSELLKTPGVSRILTSQLVARFPTGMLSLSLLLHVEKIFGSYALAGLVLAVTSIGQAIAGPLSSRFMGRFGMRPVLILTLVVEVSAIAVLSSPLLPFWMYPAIGALAGMSTPPIQPAVRTIYPKMVTSRQLTPLFSLDATAQEIIWVVGPVAATFSATQISTSFAIQISAAIMLVGGIWFLLAPELGKVRIPPSRKRLGAVLAKPTVLISTVLGFLLVGGAAAIEAGVVSVFGHDSPDSGIVLAIFSIGSLLGGLIIGKMIIRRWSLTLRMGIFFIGTAVAMFMMNFTWLSLWLFVAGIGIAPALAVIFSSIAASVKFSETAEAYGWAGTGQLIGAALGSAAAGIMIDLFASPGAFWVAAGFLFLGTLTAALTVKFMPDMSGDNLGPAPDTEPITLSPDF